MEKRRIQQILVLLALITCVCIAYANSFQNGFHFDDYHTIVNNPAIRNLSNIPRFFTDAKTFSILPANQTYRPVVSTTLAIDYWMGHGLKPFYFHIGTFLVYLLQLLGMLLLFRLTLDRTQSDSDHFLLAAFAAAWYGLHPAMAETVNYIIQRGDVYAATGVVYAMLLFVAIPKWRKSGLYLLPFVIALLSKPPAIVFPALLFAWLAMFEAPAQKRYRYAAWRTLPALVVGGAVMALEAVMTPKSYTPSMLSSYSWYITQPYVLMRDFFTFFLPLHLNVDTDLRAFPHLNATAIAGFAFLIALIAAIALFTMRRQTLPIAFGLLWFLIASLPTALYKLSEVTNDHRLFLPFIGMALACTWAGYLCIHWLAQSAKSPWIWKAATACAFLLVCACGWATHIRNRVWHSNLSLWYDDVLKSPHNGRGLMNYGLAQMEVGHYQVALDYFQRALQYTPNYPLLEVNLGIVNGMLADQGQPARAALAQQHFLRAIALAPGSDQTHAYYGRWLLMHNRLRQARQQLSLAVMLNPPALMQRDLLIQAETRLGDAAAARKLAIQTLRLAPNNAAALAALHPTQSATAQSVDRWINQSYTEYRNHQFLLSIASAQRALQIDPQSAEAWNNIAASNAALHRWKPAIAAAKKALAIDPNFTLARNNLAWAQNHLRSSH